MIQQNRTERNILIDPLFELIVTSYMSLIACFFFFFFSLLIQMFFATAILHVHLMQWEDENLVEGAVNKCDQVWESIAPEKVRACLSTLIFLLFNLWQSNLGRFFFSCAFRLI